MYRSRLAFALAMAALAAILVPSSSLTAQTTFQRTYGGADPDFGYSVQQTADGGYIIAGWTESSGAGERDVYLIKTDAHGDTLWTTTYGGADTEYGAVARQTSDGGFIVVGSTRSFGVGQADVYLIRTDADGDTLWTRTFGGTNDDYGYWIEPTADDGCIVVGNTNSFGSGETDVYLIRTDANGDTLWTRTYGGSDYDYGAAVQPTVDGGYIVVGNTSSFGAGWDDIYLIKTDSSGRALWTKTFGGTYLDIGYSVQQMADSGYVLSGATGSFGAGGTDACLVRTDASGDTEWTKTYGGADNEYGFCVQQVADGDFMVTGFTSSFGAGGGDAYLIRTDDSGDTLWTRSFGGDSFDCGYSVQQTADGGYIIAGETDSYGAGGSDVYLIKTDSLGNVAVAEPKTNPTRASALSLSCEPNPFRTRTAISLQLTADSPAELAIFDASGRRVRSFSLLSPPSSLTWDGKDELGYALPSGTYFLRLAAGSRHATARIVLQR